MPFYGLKQSRGEFNRLVEGTSPQVTDLASSAVTPAAARSKMMSRIAEFQTERNPAFTSPQPVSAIMTPPSPGELGPAPPSPGRPEAPGGGGALQPALVDMSNQKGDALSPSDFLPDDFQIMGMDPALQSYFAQNLIDEMTYNASVIATESPGPEGGPEVPPEAVPA
jgi:hypothetical protein